MILQPHPYTSIHLFSLTPFRVFPRGIARYPPLVPQIYERIRGGWRVTRIQRNAGHFVRADSQMSTQPGVGWQERIQIQ
eukprot:768172-Hanusia_phi.AAC.1